MAVVKVPAGNCALALAPRTQALVGTLLLRREHSVSSPTKCQGGDSTEPRKKRLDGAHDCPTCCCQYWNHGHLEELGRRRTKVGVNESHSAHRHMALTLPVKESTAYGVDAQHSSTLVSIKSTLTEKMAQRI